MYIHTSDRGGGVRSQRRLRPPLRHRLAGHEIITTTATFNNNNNNNDNNNDSSNRQACEGFGLPEATSPGSASGTSEPDHERA